MTLAPGARLGPYQIVAPIGAGGIPLPGFDPAAGQFFPDGRRLLLCGHEAGRPSRLFVVELPDGRPKPISPEGVSMLRWRSLAPDGRTVVARDHDHRLGLYPTEGGEPSALAYRRQLDDLYLVEGLR